MRNVNCRLWPYWSAYQPESTSPVQGENTGDMVGPGIRTQELSDESLAPYRSELSGQPIFEARNGFLAPKLGYSMCSEPSVSVRNGKVVKECLKQKFI